MDQGGFKRIIPPWLPYNQTLPNYSKKSQTKHQPIAKYFHQQFTCRPIVSAYTQLVTTFFITNCKLSKTK